jgi:hypothetical protein
MQYSQKGFQRNAKLITYIKCHCILIMMFSAIPFRPYCHSYRGVPNHPTTEYSSNFGYFLEWIVVYNITSKLEINTGLNYNYSRLKIDDKIGLIENKGNLNTSYFQLPIMIRYCLSDKFPFSISGGPYIGLLFNTKNKGTSYIDRSGLPSPDPLIGSSSITQEYNTNVSKKYKTIDLGFSVQLDYEFKLNMKLKGLILTRFNYGLTNILTDNINFASSWKNYNLIIGFGMKK